MQKGSDTMDIVVQVMGKKRAIITVPVTISKEDVIQAYLDLMQELDLPFTFFPYYSTFNRVLTDSLNFINPKLMINANGKQYPVVIQPVYGLLILDVKKIKSINFKFDQTYPEIFYLQDLIEKCFQEKLWISNCAFIDICNSNSYLKDENLSLLKEYVKVKILETYSGYTSSNYSNIINSLNSKLVGVELTNDLEKDATNLISTVFSSNVDKIYLEKNFNNDDKKLIEDMTLDILSYYEDSINKNTWMDSSTKEKAILKLKNIKINIGGNYDLEIDYDFKNNSTLLDNMILINKKNSDLLLYKLKVNDVKSIISPTVVNAYYNPLDNSINFPASLKELYKESDNYYEVLGSMGMIIAHEITHSYSLCYPNGEFLKVCVSKTSSSFGKVW